MLCGHSADIVPTFILREMLCGPSADIVPTLCGNCADIVGTYPSSVFSSGQLAFSGHCPLKEQPASQVVVLNGLVDYLYDIGTLINGQAPRKLLLTQNSFDKKVSLAFSLLQTVHTS